MVFGQLVIGAPGAGKSTYCNGMQQYLSQLDRDVAVINLDPANDAFSYDCAVDISDLVSLDAVMDELHLGPNGGLVYCMAHLLENMDWLQQQLTPLIQRGAYLILDCPGQVELFSVHGELKRVIEVLTCDWHVRLASVLLVDSHLCCDAIKYMSALLLALSTMLHLELPHVNILSKADLLEGYGDLDFNLEFYTEVQDVTHLAGAMPDTAFTRRHRRLTEGLCEVVDDMSLVNFVTLAIEDKDSVQQVVELVDAANGFALSRSAAWNPYAEDH